ncbi:class I SAM-dependent methyltransferase [Blastococcus sp. CT_GayMR20]|uniref:class I SAM-dependent methyltransferase n=1 Tax=Blastococcus sp. CT_GayMR20 TaxID=2559609 RepID=UPI0010745D0C|nr:class I SAM-dependent methyltransferase [Blastococcus sp. CT_GayMR20]TFV87681.1 class I SAM-dependent methyltransferase [Blastococcus sp. CT_GayMR20]
MLTVDYDRLDLRPGMTVLDLGCGEGRHAFEAYRRGASVVALDWGVSEVATTKQWLGAIAAAGEAGRARDGTAARYEVVRGDLLALPFFDASVDRVMASEVLEHIPDDVTAMAEIARVLKPGGRVAVTVPRYGPERICWALSDEYHANEGGHIRIYTKPVVRTRLASVGLTPGESHHAHSLHAPFWWLKCAVGVERDTALVRAYHRLLVWDLTKRPWLTRTAERVLDPLFGKSLVVYADKPAVAQPLRAAGAGAGWVAGEVTERERTAAAR